MPDLNLTLEDRRMLAALKISLDEQPSLPIELLAEREFSALLRRDLNQALAQTEQLERSRNRYALAAGLAGGLLVITALGIAAVLLWVARP